MAYVDRLLQFNLNDLYIESLATPAPMTDLGAGDIVLPSDTSLWVEIGIQYVGDDYYEPYVASGGMEPEWMNGFYYRDVNERFNFWYAFPRTVYGNPDDPEITTGYKFPSDALSEVGLLLPSGFSINESELPPQERPDGDGGWALSVWIAPPPGALPAQIEQIRIFITATQGSPGPHPEPELFWTNFVGSREIP